MREINKLNEEGLNDDTEVICFFDEDVSKTSSLQKRVLIHLPINYTPYFR